MAKKYLISLLLLGVSSAGWAAQDPTAPLGWIKPEVQASVKKKRTTKQKRVLPALQSIICQSSNSCYAIINDQVVSQGEVVSRYKIKTITEESVTVFRGGKQWKLELFSSDIKD